VGNFCSGDAFFHIRENLCGFFLKNSGGRLDSFMFADIVAFYRERIPAE